MSHFKIRITRSGIGDRYSRIGKIYLHDKCRLIFVGIVYILDLCDGDIFMRGVCYAILESFDKR